MFLRAVVPLAVLTALTFLATVNTRAQDIDSLKAGVVRIYNTRSNDVGAGVIVKVDGNEVYILTAAHVVKGDQHPRIYLFNRQHDVLQAELLDREDDDIKGLAMLMLRVVPATAAGVTALKLGTTAQLKGGEEVKIIGFPDGTAFWSVVSSNVARIEGRNLVFSGAVTGGNSGGPAIHNGVVFGMITDTGSSTAYAARGTPSHPSFFPISPSKYPR